MGGDMVKLAMVGSFAQVRRYCRMARDVLRASPAAWRAASAAAAAAVDLHLTGHRQYVSFSKPCIRDCHYQLRGAVLFIAVRNQTKNLIELSLIMEL